VYRPEQRLEKGPLWQPKAEEVQKSGVNIVLHGSEDTSGDDDQPSPKKRARTLAISSTAERSGRVLRPRKGKAETHTEEDQI